MLTQASFLKQFPGSLAFKGLTTIALEEGLNVILFFIFELSLIVNSKLQDLVPGMNI